MYTLSHSMLLSRCVLPSVSQRGSEAAAVSVSVVAVGRALVGERDAAGGCGMGEDGAAAAVAPAPVLACEAAVAVVVESVGVALFPDALLAAAALPLVALRFGGIAAIDSWMCKCALALGLTATTN